MIIFVIISSIFIMFMMYSFFAIIIAVIHIDLDRTTTNKKCSNIVTYQYFDMLFH